MTLEYFKDQIKMECARMLRNWKCDIRMEKEGEKRGIAIHVSDNQIGDRHMYALFWVDLSSGANDELPEKMKMEVLLGDRNRNLRKATGSATKILRMLNRNFKEMSIAQAAM